MMPLIETKWTEMRIHAFGYLKAVLDKYYISFALPHFGQGFIYLRLI